jgi:hypothetical protein
MLGPIGLRAIGAGTAPTDRENDRMSGSSDDDPTEVHDLEATAEWRLRKVDADPGDTTSAAAARMMLAFAEEIRQRPNEALLREYRAICGWLAEFDGIEDFALLAHDYRMGIGFTQHPETAEAYLQALITLAKRTFGTP